jgi:hypothetical protein
MKMNSKQFRTIIKESIRELIEEGAFADVVKECVKEMVSEGVINTSNIVAEQAALEKGMVKNLQLEKMAMEIGRTAAIGKDNKTAKLFEDIFADTAKTTLQKQLANDPQGIGRASNLLINDGVSPQEAAADSAQLEAFSAAGRWAQVAFTKKPSGGN